MSDNSGILVASNQPLAQRDVENDIKFDPPMYKQRYARAADILMREQWKDHVTKILDCGCGEFGFFKFIKNNTQAREILFVDIDDLLLRDFLYAVYPLNADYLIRRTHPFSVKVYAGSISHPDPVLLNTDAIVALEVIEHLYPDVLEAFPYNVFSYIHPKLVIITTPNSEFNVLFKNSKKFRHHDHKFEWTRQQFESWANNIILRFPEYIVHFEGIGLGPNGYEKFGCCSQLAVFIRKDLIEIQGYEKDVQCQCELENCQLNLDEGICCMCQCQKCLPIFSYGICTYNSYSQPNCEKNEKKSAYSIIATIDYPYEIDTRTEEEKLLDELKYRMHHFEDENSKYYNFEKRRVEIPLCRLAYDASGYFPSETEVRSLLIKFNYQIEECLNEETNQLEFCVIYDLDMNSDTSDTDTDGSGYDSEKHNNDGVSDNGKEKSDESNGSNSVQASSVIKQSSNSPSSVKKEPVFESNITNVKVNEMNDKVNKLSNILSVFNNDKINIFDPIYKERRYFNFTSNISHQEVMKKLCQEINKYPLPGTSRDNKRNKNEKKTCLNKSESLEDIHSITACILENSLNKLDCNEEPSVSSNLFIKLITEFPQNQNSSDNECTQQIFIVETNNNNSVTPKNTNPAEQEENNLANSSRNEQSETENTNIPEERNTDTTVETVPNSWSSREALFDANSQVDLLEEYDIEVSVPIVNEVACPPNYVMVADNSEIPNEYEPVLPAEDVRFPNWLLQIFDEGEIDLPEDILHDEPHYYCQGDGLGVHPSTVALDDDDDDDDDETNSITTSSSGSANFENAEANLIHDFMFPDGSGHDLVVLGQSVPSNPQIATPEANAEESSDNAEGS